MGLSPGAPSLSPSPLVQIRRCAPGSVAVSAPEAALARRRSLFSRDVEDGYEEDSQAARDAEWAAEGGAEDVVGGHAEQLGPRVMGSWRHESTRGEMLPHTVSPPPSVMRGKARAAAVLPRPLPPDVLAALARGGGSASAAGKPMPVSVLSPARTLRSADPVTVLSLDYEAPRWDARWEPTAADAGALGADDISDARAADAAIGDLRHSVTWVADPRADALYEVTFTAPADAWDAVWAHEGEDDEDDGEGDADDDDVGDESEGPQHPSSSSSPSHASPPPPPPPSPLRSPPPRGPAFLSLWGMRDLPGRALVDHVTITGVPASDGELPEPDVQAVAVEEAAGDEDDEDEGKVLDEAAPTRRRSAALRATLTAATLRRAARSMRGPR